MMLGLCRWATHGKNDPPDFHCAQSNGRRIVAVPSTFCLLPGLFRSAEGPPKTGFMSNSCAG